MNQRVPVPKCMVTFKGYLYLCSSPGLVDVCTNEVIS